MKQYTLHGGRILLRRSTHLILSSRIVLKVKGSCDVRILLKRNLILRLKVKVQ
jgi:hypothetical protein